LARALQHEYRHADLALSKKGEIIAMFSTTKKLQSFLQCPKRGFFAKFIHAWGLKLTALRFLHLPLSGLLACFAAAALFPLGASGQTGCRVLDPELARICQGGCREVLAEGYGDTYAAAYDSPAPMMLAQAQTKAETLAALGKPGEKVCRVLPVGIAVQDRIRGEVTAVKADRVTVRIEDAGRHPHMIGDKPLVKGMSVESAAADWTPCPE
jgi:hypothetical protein